MADKSSHPTAFLEHHGSLLFYRYSTRFHLLDIAVSEVATHRNGVLGQASEETALQGTYLVQPEQVVAFYLCHDEV